MPNTVCFPFTASSSKAFMKIIWKWEGIWGHWNTHPLELFVLKSSRSPTYTTSYRASYTSLFNGKSPIGHCFLLRQDWIFSVTLSSCRKVGWMPPLVAHCPTQPLAPHPLFWGLTIKWRAHSVFITVIRWLLHHSLEDLKADLESLYHFQSCYTPGYLQGPCE